MNIKNKKLFEEIIERRVFLSSTALLSLCGFLLPSSAFANVKAKGVRIGKNGNGTRFVLDVSNEINYNIFFLNNPKRLVIDLPRVVLSDVASDVSGSDSLVSNIRFGEADINTARIVLDLVDAARVSRAFTLPPQSGFDWRFVVDLEKTDENTFAEIIGSGSAISNNNVNISTEVAKNKKAEEKDLTYPSGQAVKPASGSGKSRKPIIVLDPGHGGRDPGAIGISGVFEKDIALAMGLELKKKLEKTGKYQAVLTRSKDETLSLRRRVEIAREARGDLFMSLHADSIGKRDVKGLSIYTLSEKASDKEAAALAVRENKADIIAGIDLYNEVPEVANFLIDLTRRETMNLSAEYAAIMVNEMLKSFTLLRNSHRFAGFAVLKAPDVPSILFEMGYLSNPSEEKLLRQQSYRAKLADSTVASVSKYFSSPQRASLF